MKIKNVAAVYFSATGTGMRSVMSIAHPLAEPRPNEYFL